MTDLDTLIAAADFSDRDNTGVKRWARVCKLHQQQEISALEKKREQKELRKFSQ